MALSARAQPALERSFPRPLFLLLVSGMVIVRLVLALFAPRLHEIEHIWQPLAREAAAGAPIWSQGDYHFPPLWGWLLGFFQRAAGFGFDFAAVQRSFLVLVDVAAAVLVFRLASRVPDAQPPRAAALWFLANPVSIWVSSVQGQFDGLALVFLLGALLATLSAPEGQRAIRAGILLGLSVAAKQVTALHPLLWLWRRRGVVTVAVGCTVPLLLLAPYARQWRAIARSLLVYYSVPRSYGFSELVLYDSRFGPFVGAASLLSALAAIWWLRDKEPARACLFLFLVLLFFAPGMGSQYLLWPIPFGALFGGVRYIVFSAAAIAWVLGSHFAVPGSGQGLGHLVWLSVALWGVEEWRVLRGGKWPCRA